MAPRARCRGGLHAPLHPASTIACMLTKPACCMSARTCCVSSHIILFHAVGCRGVRRAAPEAEGHSRAAAAATAGARLTPCTWLIAAPPAGRISVMCSTWAACRTLPQCTTGVYPVLRDACSQGPGLSRRSVPHKPARYAPEQALVLFKTNALVLKLLHGAKCCSDVHTGICEPG